MSLVTAYKDMTLGVKILLWMAIGIGAGIVFGEDALIVKPLGDLFIRLLLMSALPLVFFNLIAGVTSLTDIKLLGKLGSRTLFYYVFTTAFALTIGLFVARTLKPGQGISLGGEAPEGFGTVPSIGQVLLDLVPTNIFAAFSEGNVAQVVVFALLLGVATLLLPSEQKQKLQYGFEVIAALLRQLVTFVLAFAPIGVAALAAVTVGEYGSAIFGPLAKFVGSVWFAQLIMASLYMTVLFGLTRRNPLTWLKRSATLYATTAATCSSLASLVVSMDVADKKLNLPRSIYSFTLPLGAQLNKDGTSIMLACVLLFTAQATGVEFSTAELVTILVIGLILSEGSGGIPGGGLVIAMIFVEAFDLPLEVAGIVAGIYRLVDMGSTTLNCMGDLVWTTILSDIENKSRVSSGEGVEGVDS